jgi:hypothetical protein
MIMLLQCCQNGQIFRPLSKNIRPLCKNSIYHYVKLRLNFEAVLVKKSVKIPGFQYLHMRKIKETKHLRIRPLFGPFWKNPAKKSAADLSCRLYFLVF